MSSRRGIPFVAKLDRAGDVSTWKESPFLLLDKYWNGPEKPGAFVLLERQPAPAPDHQVRGGLKTGAATSPWA